MKSSNDVLNDCKQHIAKAFGVCIALIAMMTTILAAWIMWEISHFAKWTSIAAFGLCLICFFANLNFIVKNQRTIRNIEAGQDRGRRRFKDRE